MMFVLDTNFLMIPHIHGVDVLGELVRLRPEARMSTIPAVVDELSTIAAAGRGRDNLAAEVGLKLVDRIAVVPFSASGSTDDALVALAEQEDAIICTQDRELKKRLGEGGHSVVTMRSRSYLEEVIA